MNYVILDLEWNQPYTPEVTITEPFHLIGEIVQFGAIKLDENFKLTDNFKMGVRPKHYTKMNKYVKTLTKITDEDLQLGLPFSQAISAFKKWCGKDFVFLTWGYEDIPMLRDNLALHKLDDEWIPKYYNLQLIFNAQITNEKKQYSLSSAVELLHESGKEAHDALNDAINTYLICKHLDIKKGIREYSEKKKSAPADTENALFSFMSPKVFAKKSDSMNDKEIISFLCPDCKKRVFCRRWVGQNAGKKFTIGNCSCGKAYLVRLKFKKSGNGYCVKQLVYEADNSLIKFYKKALAKQALQKARN